MSNHAGGRPWTFTSLLAKRLASPTQVPDATQLDELVRGTAGDLPQVLPVDPVVLTQTASNATEPNPCATARASSQEIGLTSVNSVSATAPRRRERKFRRTQTPKVRGLRHIPRTADSGS